jgi:site-specific DNA-cytosine methylase
LQQVARLLSEGYMVLLASMNIHNKIRTQQDLPFSGQQNFQTPIQWLRWVEKNLPKPNPSSNAPLALDLFAGCGGLALGFECAGFRTVGFEMKSAASNTYSSNLSTKCEQIVLEVGSPDSACDIIIGGPPCQPFSQIGYQRGKRDLRDGVPIFLDAVRRLKPKIAIFENVRGLLFRNKDYLISICSELEGLGYEVDARLLNAKDFGAPQNRERVFVVASKVGWQWPDTAVQVPVSAGMALGDSAFQIPENVKFLNESMDRYIANYERRSQCITPRDLHLDRPARTLTCRNFGGATSDMLRIKLTDGRRRMLTVREGARLQGFPDWFEFSGTEYEQMEQIGNAVSPLLSLALGRQAMRALENPMKKKVSAANVSRSMHKETPIGKKLRQALTLLGDIGVDLRSMTSGRQKRVAMALLAVAHLRPKDSWSEARSFLEDNKAKLLSQRGILRFWNEHYGTKLADSSYDDVKRKDLVHLEGHQLVVAGARDPDASINDGTRGHALSLAALRLIRAYDSDRWPKALNAFKKANPNLTKAAAERRRRSLVPISLPGGKKLKLSPGPHNVLQQAIVKSFLGGFVPDAEILYIADSASRKSEEASYVNAEKTHALGLPLTKGDMSVDIIAVSSSKEWVFLIEAVHSSNPLTPARHNRLKSFTKNCKYGRVYVTAFQSRKDFRKYVSEISWETEVWIAEEPDHLIHFNGDRFLGPHKDDEAKK